MWGWGTIMHIPQKHSISINLEDEDGYPIEKYKKIEEKYEKMRQEKNPQYVPPKIWKSGGSSDSFTDYPDRPSRYMQ
jgi:hypothetical protein